MLTRRENRLKADFGSEPLGEETRWPTRGWMRQSQCLGNTNADALPLGSPLFPDFWQGVHGEVEKWTPCRGTRLRPNCHVAVGTHRREFPALSPLGVSDSGRCYEYSGTPCRRLRAFVSRPHVPQPQDGTKLIASQPSREPGEPGPSLPNTPGGGPRPAVWHATHCQRRFSPRPQSVRSSFNGPQRCQRNQCL